MLMKTVFLACFVTFANAVFANEVAEAFKSGNATDETFLRLAKERGEIVSAIEAFIRKKESWTEDARGVQAGLSALDLLHAVESVGSLIVAWEFEGPEGHNDGIKTRNKPIRIVHILIGFGNTILPDLLNAVKAGKLKTHEDDVAKIFSVLFHGKKRALDFVDEELSKLSAPERDSLAKSTFYKSLMAN